MNNSKGTNPPFAPDPIWMHFANGKSFDDFVSSYPAFVYHDKVPVEIRQHLDDVHALLIHSYFRYRFLDIAHARAMQVVEMALRVRHRELGSPEIRHGKRVNSEMEPSLRELLNWADREGLLEDSDNHPSWRQSDQKLIDVLRYLRNHSIHANESVLLGVTIVGLLHRVVDFINELYDDPEKRKARHDFERTLQTELTRVTSSGAILEVDGIRFIVFHSEVLNAVPDCENWDIHLGVLKIFPAAPDEVGSHELPDPIVLKLRGYVVENNRVSFGSGDGSRVYLHAIQDETNSERYQSFKSEFEKHPILFTAAIQPLADRRIQLKRLR